MLRMWDIEKRFSFYESTSTMQAQYFESKFLFVKHNIIARHCVVIFPFFPFAPHSYLRYKLPSQMSFFDVRVSGYMRDWCVGF